ncbi:YggS family pyridoxal phosphate-dependent enzyme [Solwaraspora sp. WMMD937]|uniref:YggS family pyridoxal phosphate-dependent enzyme n=1 Tax=Solwaraspora sp. WMMD937 TaxID=3016090 RepID=UPI00249C4BB2|nr:YggS family pyridoxal phosphate-dependent enzyme [Solwaraspora sp. WMMD937]WFE21007.1 YggS family pyridoxal phosphate-dependent enzyme [Solwaraspora sp. WMMD937]
MTVDTERRRAELADRLAAVRSRLAAATAAAGRPVDSVTLIAVTKTYPAADVRLLAELGVTDVGENRDQEAAAKAAELAPGPSGGPGLRWHFVGQLQRNKCRSVVGYADLVHSVDRVPLARALAAAAGRRGRPLDVLVQVSLDGMAGRGGALPDSADGVTGFWPVVECILSQSDLRLAGVMAVAPLDQPPEPAFARLAEVSDQLRAAVPEAWMVSAGMSADLEAAVDAGATHVRVGSALLGKRPTLR